MKIGHISFVLILLLTLLQGCGGIKMISGSKSDLYSKEFMDQVNVIKKDYSSGNKDSAITKLQAIDDNLISEPERALKYNLLGVISFSLNNFEEAKTFFSSAKVYSGKDPELLAQIQLNLASTHFKALKKDEAYDELSQIQVNYLGKNEKNKYFKLRYELAQLRGDNFEEIDSLVGILKDIKSGIELKSESYYESLRSKFLKLSDSEKYKIFENYSDDNPFVLGYLAYLEAERLYFRGSRENANELMEWIESKYGHHDEIKTLVQNFNQQATHLAQIEPLNIGVILPMSGEKKAYGQRALRGIDAAIQELKKNDEFQLNVFTRDSKGSGVVGSYHVKDLLEKHKVGIIIGGLFATEAKKEYEQSRRLGIFYISLSDIYVPRSDKDHMLLELPGSVESQVARLFSEKMVNNFGTKAAIIYPDTPMGEAYVEEFWNTSKENNIEVVDVLKFQTKGRDLRDPIKNLLGLKYTRVRQEEYDLLSEIYDLEGKKSLRRVQVLKPQIDFDWVFMPALPHDAIQLIPTFTYYDAFDVKLFGGPSWRSKRLSKESHKFKNIYFVGENVKEGSQSFQQHFYELYKNVPRLIEIRSYDSLKIAHSIIKAENFTNRQQLETHLRDRGELSGLTGSWTQENGLWIKNMSLLRLINGRVEKELLSTPAKAEASTEEEATETSEQSL
jgi:ABC-type branched-subunit amino acid transport system substrate-binding protein